MYVQYILSYGGQNSFPISLFLIVFSFQSYLRLIPFITILSRYCYHIISNKNGHIRLYKHCYKDTTAEH